MLKALDIANFFVDLYTHSPENDITNMKLNKLVFLSQAWALVLFDAPLFPDIVEAWKHGPVVPNVYHEFEQYEADIIKKPSNEPALETFPSEVIDLLLDIDMNYGKYPALELSRITHEPCSPWKQCYSEGTRNICIPNKCMKAYYSKKTLKTLEPDSAEFKTIGYRGPDGIIVLPADEDCEEDDIYNSFMERCA